MTTVMRRQIETDRGTIFVDAEWTDEDVQPLVNLYIGVGCMSLALTHLRVNALRDLSAYLQRCADAMDHTPAAPRGTNPGD